MLDVPTSQAAAAPRCFGVAVRTGLTLLLLGLLTCTSCTSMPMAPPALDTAAKQFQPPGGAAHLYVVRPAWSGSSMPFRVLIDGRLQGFLPREWYLVIPLPAGSHVVSSFTESHQVALTLVVVPGRNYFVRLFPKLGWGSGHVGMDIIDEAEGREAVQAATLLQRRTPP